MPATESSKPLSGRRVLVIEDEYYLADDIACALAALGAQVIGPIGEFEEAASLIETDVAIDAAVLDVNLRSDMIFPVARTLRARKVPLLFTTGYDRTSIEPEFNSVHLWEKPLDIPAMTSDLVALIQGA